MGKIEKKGMHKTLCPAAEILNQLWTISRNYKFLRGLTAGHWLKGHFPVPPLTEHFTFTCTVPANSASV